MALQGGAVVAGLLYLVNLKKAIEEFSKDDKTGAILNLLSASASVGGGINSGLNAYRTISPEKFTGIEARSTLIEQVARKATARFFGYTGAIFDFLSDAWKSGQLISKSDTDAGLYYAGSAITVGLGGAALTYGATGAAVLLGPIGWIALGAVLTGTSIALMITGDAKKDSAVEKWLDACSFGQRTRPDAPTYNSLAEEMQALGLALHTPTLLDTDWTDKWGWPDYKAEAVIFLPGYNSSTSLVRASANGKHLGPYVKSDGDGGIAQLRCYLPKSEGVEKVSFEVRYRPDDRFDKDYILNFTVHEPRDESNYNAP